MGDRKSDWPLTRFGDVVREVRETECDPLANGIEGYIGLEHLDPESLGTRRRSYPDVEGESANG